MDVDRSSGAGASDRVVVWSRVVVFYLIALGLVTSLAFGLSFLGARFDPAGAQLVFQLIIAFLYMPMPLVAGLVVERMAGRPASIRRIADDFKHRFASVALVSVVVTLAIYGSLFLVTLVGGNLLGITGVGRLAFSDAEVAANLVALAPEAASADAVSTQPPVVVLYVLGAIGGLVAGFTVNGLFAFGEEYGWRGVLMDELAPLGPVRANLLTGVLWGLWHAPIIALGFNYPGTPVAGALVMCIWVTPLSFILWRSRELSGSVLAPAVIHGAFNGSAGVLTLLVADRNPLLAVPVGLASAVALSVIALVMWRIPAVTGPSHAPAVSSHASESAA